MVLPKTLCRDAGQSRRAGKGDVRSMSKVDVYIGGYHPIQKVSKQESERLASNECMIGMPLSLSHDAESGDFVVTNPATGNSIGSFRPKNPLSLRDALENGWTCHCWLSLVYYVEAEKIFQGEIVYQCFKVKPSQTAEQAALETYALNTAEALKSGKRPRVILTGNTYDAVIESSGAWQSDEKEVLPFSTKRGSGIVPFKKKRSLLDKLALSAMERKPGCRIALTVVLLIIVIAIALVVWKCAVG